MDTVTDQPETSINIGFWTNEVAVLLHTGSNEDAPVDPRNVVHLLSPDEAVGVAKALIEAATQALLLGVDGDDEDDEDDEDEYYGDEEDDDQGGHDVGSDPDFGRYDEGPHD
jgi:hypothetical protein